MARHVQGEPRKLYGIGKENGVEEDLICRPRLRASTSIDRIPITIGQNLKSAARTHEIRLGVFGLKGEVEKIDAALTRSRKQEALGTERRKIFGRENNIVTTAVTRA